MDLATLGLRVDSSQVDKANASLKKFSAGSSSAEAAAAKMSSTGKRAAASMGEIAGKLVAVTVSAATVGKVVNTLAGFDRSMARVAAISGASADELARMRDTAKGLGATTEFTAGQVADGMKFLSMAGFEASESMAAIPTVLDLATASGADLATTADQMSNIMSTFGIEAGNAAQAADLLAAMSAAANTDVGEMAQAITFAGSTAVDMGVSIETLSGALGILADNGIKSSRAGTTMRMMMSKLASPTKEAVDALDRYGLSTDDIDVKSRGLVPVLQSLADAHMDTAAATALVGTEAASNLSILLRNIDGFAEYEKVTDNAAGSLERMAGIMRDQLGGDLSSFGSAVDGLILAMGDAGLTAALRSLVQGATELVRAFAGMENLDVVVKALGLVGAAVAVLIAPFATLGIAAAAAAAALYLHWDDITEKFPIIQTVVTGVLNTIVESFTFWKDAIGAAIDYVMGYMDDISTAASALMSGDWKTAWESASNVVSGVADDVAAAVADLSEAAIEALSGMKDDAVAKMGEVWEAVKDGTVTKLGEVWGAISDTVDQWVADFGAYAESMVDEFLDSLGDMGSNVSVGVGVVWDEISRVAGDWVNDFAAYATDMVAGFLDEMANMASDARQALVAVWEEISAEIASWPGAFVDLGIDIIDGLIQGIKESPGRVRDALGGVVTGGVDWVKSKLGIQSPSKVFRDIGHDTIDGLIVGVEDKTNEANKAMRDVAEGTIDVTKEVYSTMKDIFDGVMDGTIDSWKDALDVMKNAFVNWLKQMIQTAIANPVMLTGGVSLTGGAAGTAANAAAVAGAPQGGISSAFGLAALTKGVGSFIGSTGGMGVLGGASGLITNTLANGLSGFTGYISSAIAGATSGLGGLGAAIGAVAVPLAAVAVVIGAFKEKVELLKGGLQGAFDGLTVSYREFERTKRSKAYGLSTETSTRYSDAGSKWDALREAVDATVDSTIDMAKSLGVAQSAFKDIDFTVRFDLADKGKDAKIEEVNKRLSQITEKMAEDILPQWVNIAREGENAGDVLVRLAQSLNGVNTMLELLGQTTYEASVDGGVMASKLADAFGGLDQMAAASQSFVTGFYSEAEQLDMVFNDLQAAFGEFGREVPKTKADYRALAESIDLTRNRGRKLYATLLLNSSAFDTYITKSEELAQSGKSLDDLIPILDGISSGVDDVGSGADASSDSMNNVGDALDGLSEDLTTVSNETEWTGTTIRALGEDLTEFSKEGEWTGDTIMRLVGNTQALNDVFVNLGNKVVGITDVGVTSVAKLSELVGGFEALMSATQNYVNLFVSSGAQMKMLRSQLSNDLSQLGVEIPATREAFVSLVQGLDITKKRGRDLYAVLIQNASGFDQLYTAVEAHAAKMAEREARQQAAIAGIREFNGALRELGIATINASESGLRAARNFTQLFGSLDALGSSVQSYVSMFYSAAEQTKMTRVALRKGLADFNREIPSTRAGFRELVEGLDLTKKKARELFSFLMQNAGAFDSVYTAAETRAQKQADRAAAKADRAAAKADRQDARAAAKAQRIADREKAKADKQQAAADQRAAEAQAAADEARARQEQQRTDALNAAMSAAQDAMNAAAEAAREWGSLKDSLKSYAASLAGDLGLKAPGPNYRHTFWKGLQGNKAALERFPEVAQSRIDRQGATATSSAEYEFLVKSTLRDTLRLQQIAAENETKKLNDAAIAEKTLVRLENLEKTIEDYSNKTETNTKTTARMLKRWESNGMPATRT